jgi:uncharacterized membrane protein YdjX (TVP38/TMEM64 family)
MLQNVLVGAVFGQLVGFPLVCLLTGLGATTCFLMSKYFAAGIVHSYLPDQCVPVRLSNGL